MKLPRISILASLVATTLAAHAAGVISPNGDLLRAQDGAFYGVSSEGGSNGHGTIFRVTPFSELNVLANFTGDDGAAKGSRPRAALVADGGLLWGTTQLGGTASLGTVFKFNPITRVLTTVVEFSGPNGAQPEAALVLDGAGFAWGTTRLGGANELGTLFKIEVATGTLTTVVDFTGTTGAAKGSQPKAGLLRDATGVLWGTTANGGTLDLGTVFSLDPATPTFTTVAEFTGTSGAVQGSAPLGVLTDDGAGFVLGTTDGGGSGNLGTVFKMEKASGALTTMAHFTGPNGSNPKAGVISDGAGSFWGTTNLGGANTQGTVFKVNANSGVLNTVANLSGTGGVVKATAPFGGLTDDGAGNFWGTGSKGGRDDLGTVFKVNAITGVFTLIVEPEPSPVAPQAAVQAPPGSATTGNAADPLTLHGVARDNVVLSQVLISLNGGPFVPATFTPGTKAGTWDWQLDVIPENGTNVVIVKSVDTGGNSSKTVTLFFNYTVKRPDLAGAYNGLALADLASATPFNHTGVFTMKALENGRLTGKLSLGGNVSASLTGAFGNDGAVRFGKSGVKTLSIVRKNLPPLLLELSVDASAPFTRQIIGTLRENNVVVATIRGDQSIYTSKKNPLPPLTNVPTTLLNPATDKGVYTGIFAALTPAAQGLPATEFPQGDGYALLKVLPTGKVTLAGKLADGTAFATSNSLSLDNALPVFIKLQGGVGSLAGFVNFRDQSTTDADGANLRWFKPASTKVAAYRGAWPLGIGVDFAGSKFVAPKITGLTPLGNQPAPSPATSNALRETSHTLTPGTLTTQLSINAAGKANDIAAPGVVADMLLPNGAFLGSHLDHAGAMRVSHAGVVLQKSQSASGFFLIAPAAAPKDPKHSGRVTITAQ